MRVIDKFPQTLWDLMLEKLGTILAWAHKNGLGVNPCKNELVIFTRKYKIPNLKLPKLLNESLTLNRSSEVSF